MKSDNSIAVAYEGTLHSDTEYTWALQVWDNHGCVARKSTSRWYTGIRVEDWKAQWITASEAILPASFRKVETLSGKVRKATAYITSHGIYEALSMGNG